MTTQELIEDLQAKHKRWGLLVREMVPSDKVMEIIEHYEARLASLGTATAEAADNNLRLIEQLQGELTTERRRVAACNARETGLKNKLQALKDETRTGTGSTDI